MQMQRETPVEILNLLRNKIKQRGIRGILNLFKQLFQADDSGSKQIDLVNLLKILKDLRIGLADEQIKVLFEWFDRDQKGQIDYDELLITLKGDMNEQRKNLTITAFAKLDKNQSGKIDFKVIKDMFVASSHPDIKFYKKTEEEVIGDFIDTFDLHHALLTKDDQTNLNVVTLDEFIEYYSYVSMMIDDDKYYE